MKIKQLRKTMVLGSAFSALLLSGGVFAEKIVPITELPEVFITKNHEIPMDYLEYLYYPFDGVGTPKVRPQGNENNARVLGGGEFYLSAGDVVVFQNKLGDTVKLTATTNATRKFNGFGEVPFEFVRGRVKITVNDKSAFKSYFTVSDIDTNEWVNIKKSDIYKIAIPETSDLQVRISDDGEWYTVFSNVGHDIRDPKGFFTVFLDELKEETGIGFNGAYSVDFSNRVSWKKPEFGSFIQRFLDQETGEILAEEVLLTGAIGSGYQGTPKLIEHYDLVEQPQVLQGNFENTIPVVFEYKYVRQQGKVIVKYQAEIGDVIKKLSLDEEISGKVGTDFVAKIKEFDGFEYKGQEVSGKIEKGDREVVYVYSLTIPIDLSPIRDIETYRNKKMDLDVVSTKGPVEKLEVSGLPTGLTYDPVTKIISGKVTDPVGKYLVTVIAEGRYGDKKEVQFTITVKAPRRNDDADSSTPKVPQEEKIVEKAEEPKVQPEDSEIFNPTIENGKCYTRRAFLGIKDSKTIQTSEEFKKALSFLWSYEMTMYDSVDGYDPVRNLSREEAAKLFSQFAMNVLCRKPDKNLTVHYTDTADADPTLKPFITLAYQLGVMKGSGMGDGEFRPHAYISKAEVNAVLIRMILKSYLDETGATWYYGYNKVSESLKITQQWPGSEFLSRNDLALMLFRAYKNQEFEWREIGYFSFVLKLRDLFVK